MSYHLGTNDQAARTVYTSDPEAGDPANARWYRATPSVVSFMRSAYPNDPAVRQYIIEPSATKQVFFAVDPNGLAIFAQSCSGDYNTDSGAFSSFGVHSSVAGGRYAEPVGEPALTWAYVQDVCGLARRGVEPRRPARVENKAPFVARPQAKINIGLYVAFGVSAGLMLLAVGALARKKR